MPRPASRQTPACCDLGPIHGLLPPGQPPPPFTYRDDYGFVYHLCPRHCYGLLTGLFKAAQTTEAGRTEGQQLQHQRRPSRGRHARRTDDPVATGMEQRRARLRLGWSIRRMETELGRSRAQLSAAEHGHRPVDPDVARWVRQVLDGVVEGVDAGAPVVETSR